ncbi:MAG: hypothetical protein ACO3XO_10395, partial [Bdellovibrionota bacterium]
QELQSEQELQGKQDKSQTQSTGTNQPLTVKEGSELSLEYPGISTTAILITASLRQKLQHNYPDWSVTSQQRAVVKNFTTARLAHEKSLSDPSYTSRALITEARGLELFSRSINNLAQASKKGPLQQTTDTDLNANEISPDSPTYQNEVIGSLWATQAAFLIYRDNEQLFNGLLKILGNRLQETQAIFQNETFFNHVMSSMLRSGSYSEARNQLLQTKWLGLREDDLPPMLR